MLSGMVLSCHLHHVVWTHRSRIKDLPLFYEIARGLVRPLLLVVYRPRIRGAHRIPDEGPVILASNHPAGADTVFMPVQVGRVVHFLAKADFFAGTGLLTRALAAFLRAVKAIPVDRHGGSASGAAVDAALEVLARSQVVGIYPEGTRSPDGRLYRGKTGVVRIALASGALIVPVAMVGSFEAQRGRRFVPRRHPRMQTLIGSPVHVSELMEDTRTPDPDAVRRATDEVMRRIQQLSGQEYVDRYAAEVKRELADGGELPRSSSAGPGL